ncbi:MAG: oxidoreductase [Candidatus Fraserbacteria bacterium RBG_16_55_9]|uniref:Oxidoreductase n=1 Tax=Fraserbacteria sp. (strain RBG_16_55_9) TaxID=1817864 RepID=A0A1F5V156_FRAXR|nr:MAG: oxidoreductase [Candidatus Fraserbacteria bacterium RBG_16_55_9]
MSKPKLGFYWCASCGGCEEAVVDLAEDVLKVVEAVDIVFWPVALDFKREDVEKMKDGELAVCFLNGAIRTSEQEEMAELLRRKSQLLIAFGSCSHLGGIPGLANLFDREAIFEWVYRDAPSVTNSEGVLPQEETRVPEGTVRLPAFRDTVRTLDQVVDVDYYVPGCPPPVNLIANALAAILDGKLPPKGTVLAPDVALCDECPRKATKPDKLAIKELKRPHQVLMDPETCLLAQGLLCMGPATRSGCGAPCVSANMPCTGCLGPTSRVKDQGAKALSAIASLLDSNDEREIATLMDQIVDPVGTLYRYSLPASLLHRRVRRSANGGAPRT